MQENGNEYYNRNKGFVILEEERGQRLGEEG